MHPKRQTPRSLAQAYQLSVICFGSRNLAESRNRKLQTGREQFSSWRGHLCGGKSFHRRRSVFPLPSLLVFRIGQQWARKLKTCQIVTIGMGYPYALGAQRARGFRQLRRGCQRRTGYLQQQLRREWQKPPHGHESPGGAYIECRGKLQELLAFIVTTLHKNRNRQWQPRPFATFSGAGSNNAHS